MLDKPRAVSPTQAPGQKTATEGCYGHHDIPVAEELEWNERVLGHALLIERERDLQSSIVRAELERR